MDGYTIIDDFQKKDFEIQKILEDLQSQCLCNEHQQSLDFPENQNDCLNEAESR